MNLKEIYDFFNSMKEDEPKDYIFGPSMEWKKIIEKSSINNKDIIKKIYHEFEYDDFYSNKLDKILVGLRSPTVTDKFSHYSEIISDLMDEFTDKHFVNILEIGCGFGGVAYEVFLKNDMIKYILVDIPEVLVLASIFINKVFPEKKIFLYGSMDIELLDYNEFDMVLIPSHSFLKIEKFIRDVDIAINMSSFAEMDLDVINSYISILEKNMKSGTYFLHSNSNEAKRKNEFFKENPIDSWDLVSSDNWERLYRENCPYTKRYLKELYVRK